MTGERVRYQIFDIMDLFAQAVAYMEVLFMHYVGTWSMQAYGLIMNLVVIQFLAVTSLLLQAGTRRKAPALGAMGKLCLMFSIIHSGCAAPTGTNAPRARGTSRPQPTSDLELWRSGQETLREQLARADQRRVLEQPLEKSAGEAPPPEYEQPWRPVAQEEALVVVPGNLIHVTLWTATPFYEVEVTDVEVPFPVTLHCLKRALRESFTIIPAYATEVVPTVPQLGDGFASFVAIPGWLRTTGNTVLLLDCRAVGGAVFAIQQNGVASKENILQHVDGVDAGAVEVFVFGTQNPLVTGFPVDPLPGGLVKILPRGQVCEWEDDLDFRFDDEDRWDPECSLPPDLPGWFVSYQSTEEQIIYEDDPDDPRRHAEIARDLFDVVHYTRLPEEVPAHLAISGRTIIQTVAVVDQAWPEVDDAVYIFLDVRGLGLTPQWVRAAGAQFDPVAYFEALQLPEVDYWTLNIGGGEPIGNNILRVREGELLEFHMLQGGDSSTSERDTTDEDSDSSGDDPGGDATDDSMGDVLRSPSSAGDEPRNMDGPPRGPSPPTPMRRSRSPRRRAGDESPGTPKGCLNAMATGGSEPPRNSGRPGGCFTACGANLRLDG